MSLFVTLEGIDGSGKTTLARKLHQALVARGVDAVLTKEPTDTWVGEAVKRAVEEDMDPVVQALLFMADRSLHVEEIEAWLSEGKTVICDRYHDSTLAYQGAALKGRFPDPIEWLKRASSSLFIRPDLTFLLVVDPEEGLARLAGVRERTPFERVEFLRRVQENYLRLADDVRFVKLDASRSPDVVRAEAVGILLEKLQQ